LEHFSFFAPATLIKSGHNGKRKIRVGGLISSEAKDADGEIVESGGIDFNYFTSGFGKIKFEHDSPLLKEPDNIIGFPDKLIRKGKDTFFEGTLVDFEGVPDGSLTPQQKAAKSAYGLLKSMEDHNADSPSIPQKAGWSIEGDVLERDKATRRVKKSIVTNVVLTTKPVNTTTYATLIKSLNTGYEVNPANMSGIAVARKESIEEGNLKHNKNTKGVKCMFKNRQEAYDHYLAKGMSEEKATEMANVWETESKAETALTGARESLQKSIKEIEAIEKIELEASNPEKLRKSLKTLQEDEEADLGAYLGEKQQTDFQNAQNIEQLAKKVDGLAKSLSSLVAGIDGLLQYNAYSRTAMQKSISANTEISAVTAKGVAKLVGVQAGKTGLVTDGIQNMNYTDNNKPQPPVLNRQETLTLLKSLQANNEITADDVMNYELTGRLTPTHEALVKSKATGVIG
jgi:hypothetical protein